MKKSILKIFICMFVLLVGIGAVNALEDSGDDLSSVDDNKNSVKENSINTTVQKLSNEKNNCLTVKKNESKKTAIYTTQDNGILTQTETKKFLMYKMKIPKKYWKYTKNINKAPKKFKKLFKKQMKTLEKASYKKSMKLYKNHWYTTENDVSYKISKKAKFYYVSYYLKCYRTYNYDIAANEGWWEV